MDVNCASFYTNFPLPFNYIIRMTPLRIDRGFHGYREHAILAHVGLLDVI